jgi:hypothetical protein
MAKVTPFHTDSPEYAPTHREVYHDDSACSQGKKIQDKHRKSGKGNKKLCSECAKL